MNNLRKTWETKGIFVLKLIYAFLNSIFFTLVLSIFFLVAPGNTGATGFNHIASIETGQITMFLSGDYLYVGQGKLFLLFDISETSSPAQIASLIFPSTIEKIKVYNNRAYVVTEDFFYVLDIETPKEPLIIGSYHDSREIYDFVIKGNQAYLFYNENNFFQVIDFSEPGDMKFVAQWVDVNEEKRDITQLEVVEDYLYVVFKDEIVILDISNPIVFFEAGKIEIAESDNPNISLSYTEISIYNQYAYVKLQYSTGHPRVVSEAKEYIYDISDPANPRFIQEVDYPGVVSDGNFSVDKGYPGYPSLGTIVLIYDLSDPLNPQKVGEASFYNLFPDEFALKYPYLFTPIYSKTLWLIDVENPLINIHGSIMPLWELEQKKYHFMTGSDRTDALFMSYQGIQFADFFDPVEPKISDVYDYGLKDEECFAYSSPFIYTVNKDSSFQILDTTQRDNPVIISSLVLDVNATAITIQGENAYVAGTDGLVIVDIKDPEMPFEAGVFTSQDFNATSVAVSNGYAFIASGESGLKVLDVSAPDNVSQSASLTLTDEAVLNVAVQDTTLYIATEHNVFRFDITTPLQPIYTDHYSVPDYITIKSISVLGEFLFITLESQNSSSIEIIRDTYRFSKPDELAKVVSSGDFNGDGKSDILHFQKSSGTIEVHLSQDGRFSKESMLKLEDINSPDAYGIWDFNSDGFYDILWHETGSNLTNIYFNQGYSLSFNPPINLAPMGAPNTIAVGDFGKYGDYDELNLNFFWYENWDGLTFYGYLQSVFGLPEGILGYRTHVTIQVPEVLLTGHFCDIDHDIIMLYTSYNNKAVFYPDLYLSNNSCMILEGLGKPDASAAGDFNGDGFDDILWYEEWYNETAQVFVSNGIYLSLEPGFTMEGMTPPAWIVSGDFDGDGLSDLLWSDATGDTARAWLSDGTRFVRTPAFDLDLSQAN